jgi:hypothetical protein
MMCIGNDRSNFGLKYSNVISWSNVNPNFDNAVYQNTFSYPKGRRVVRQIATSLPNETIAPVLNNLTLMDEIYESLVDANLGNSLFDNTKWIYVGKTNRYSMFDDTNILPTINNTPYTVGAGSPFIPPVSGNGIAYTFFMNERINSIALNGIKNVKKVRIRLYGVVGVDVVLKFDESFTLEEKAGYGLNITDWHSYFFEVAKDKTQLIIYNIPDNINFGDIMDVMFDVKDGSKPVYVDNILMGQSFKLGTTRYGVKLGIDDFSRKEVDQFGTTTLVKRNFARRVDATLNVKKGDIDAVYNFLTSNRATNVMWVIDKGMTSVNVFGWWANFDIVFEDYDFQVMSLEIKSLSEF